MKEKSFLSSANKIMLGIMLLIIIIIVFLIATWKKRNAVEVEIETDETAFEVETLDYVYYQPIKDSDGDGKPYILVIGNNALQCSDSDLLLPDYIEEQTGYKVDYLYADNTTFSEKVNPDLNLREWSAFSAVGLVDALISKDFSKQNDYKNTGVYVHGEDNKEYFNTLLNTIDLNEVDIILFSYSLNDFFNGVPSGEVWEPGEPQRTFNGALRHVIPALQEAYPHIRIMMSTPYLAYLRNDDGTIQLASSMVVAHYNGSKMASDIIDYSVENNKFSVIDNYHYKITERNVTDYVDGFVLNEKGLKLVGDHIIEIINQ
ncbi:MAG: hypothetical protein J6U37_01505 [Lachnospiraceae bacterium]|nr:hypothetical protein [Lachnospiraceae bacterium]